MTPALRASFALIVALMALTAANLARYGGGWAWASVIIGIGALASSVWLLIVIWKSKAGGTDKKRPPP